MKKLRDKIEQSFLKAEDRWKVLPLERQQFLTKVFFGTYVLLTIIVITGICISTGQRNNTMSIKHIDGISKKPVETGAGQNDVVNSPSKK